MEVYMDAFIVIGIAIRTTNRNSQSTTDILKLWDLFLKSNIVEKIPNKASSEIYSIYTDYEEDEMAPYTVILGCKVKNSDDVPEGMVAREVPAGKYEKHLVQGNLNEGVIFEAWKKIWNSKLNRAYTVDFEVYGEKARNPEDAEVEIFVAIK